MNQISAQAQFVRCDSAVSDSFEDAPDGAVGGESPLHRAADGEIPLHHPSGGPPPPAGEVFRESVLTPSRKLRFLDELSRHGNVRVAASRIGVSRSAVYLAQRRDAAFASGWRAALVRARDHAEAVLAERALEGVEEQVFYRGELVGSRRRYDSRLLLAHLARLDRLCAEDARAVDDAARFDAVIGDLADLPEAAERHPETGAALTWPPRAEFVAEARADASAEARSLVAHGEGADRWTEEVFDRDTVDAAEAGAGEEWDGFHDTLYRAVDAVLGGEDWDEDGGGGRGARGGVCEGACGGACEGSGFVVQDCVQCVQSINPSPRHSGPPSRHPRAGEDPSDLAASRTAAIDSRLRGNDEGGGGETFGEGGA